MEHTRALLLEVGHKLGIAWHVMERVNTIDLQKMIDDVRGDFRDQLQEIENNE